MTRTDLAPVADFPPVFAFTEEHAALRGVLRRFFETAEATRNPGYGWRRLLSDLGVEDIIFARPGETVATPVDLAILAEEAGGALYPGPLLATAALGPVLAGAAGESGTPAVGSGSWPGIALSADFLGAARDVSPGISGSDGVRLSGVVEPVLNLDGAGLIGCPALINGAPALAVLRADAPGVTITELSALDPSQPLGRIECRAVTPESVILDGADLEAVRRRAHLVVAAELLGVAQRSFDRTVEYVSRRVQFGRTIGSFQAIKHRLADLVTQVELTRSAVYGAAWQLTVAPTDPRTERDLAVAGALASGTATAVAKEAVQLHGGIAITWEHRAHRYLRRAHQTAAFTGGASAYRHRLAVLIDLEEKRHGSGA
ncbi:acyl-CoA dehydrogenase family protein [Nocardia yamanashiensis]|uniref:acyl-CoA dehydrogenase family protein n=1 Tax=Nocardia yamanashiensis TaxID=209247 RepID=UPI00083330C9|nr:acyl-CoA dehydrogenase family protein [Nocardia yamanashiensis]